MRKGEREERRERGRKRERGEGGKREREGECEGTIKHIAVFKPIRSKEENPLKERRE